MQKPDFAKLKYNLKREVEENPLAALGVAAVAMTGAAKLIDSLSGVQSKRAYAKRMNRKK